MEPIALTLTFLLIYEIMATEPTKYRANKHNDWNSVLVILCNF